MCYNNGDADSVCKGEGIYGGVGCVFSIDDLARGMTIAKGSIPQ